MRSQNHPPPNWQGIGVHSAATLRRAQRRADRLRQGIGDVLAAMESDAALRMMFVNGRSLWTLTNGTFVHAEIAAAVIAKPNVVDCGDSLFVGMPAQTFRLAEQGR